MNEASLKPDQTEGRTGPRLVVRAEEADPKNWKEGLLVIKSIKSMSGLEIGQTAKLEYPDKSIRYGTIESIKPADLELDENGEIKNRKSGFDVFIMLLPN